MHDKSQYFFRFFLEVIAFLAIGWWGSSLANSWGSVFLGIALAVFAMMIWGVFNVPNDPSRSGKAPVVVPGKMRLLIELFIFLWASYSIWTMINIWFASVYLVAVLAHNMHIKERNIWIWRN